MKTYLYIFFCITFISTTCWAQVSRGGSSKFQVVKAQKSNVFFSKPQKSSIESTNSTNSFTTNPNSTGFNNNSFSTCGTTQTCSNLQYTGGEIKFYIDRIVGNTAYFRIIKCNTQATPYSIVSFSTSGYAFIKEASACGDILNQVSYSANANYIELSVTLTTGQASKNYYAVTIPGYNPSNPTGNYARYKSGLIQIGSVVNSNFDLNMRSNLSFSSAVMDVGNSYPYTFQFENNGNASWTGDVYMTFSNGVSFVLESNYTLPAGYYVSFEGGSVNVESDLIGENLTVTIEYRTNGTGVNIPIPNQTSAVITVNGNSFDLRMTQNIIFDNTEMEVGNTYYFSYKVENTGYSTWTGKFYLVLSNGLEIFLDNINLPPGYYYEDTGAWFAPGTDILGEGIEAYIAFKTINENNLVQVPNQIPQLINIRCPTIQPPVSTPPQICGNGVENVSISLNASNCTSEYVWMNEEEAILQSSSLSTYLLTINSNEGNYDSKILKVACKEGACLSEKVEVVVNVNIKPVKPFEGEPMRIINLGDETTLDVACDGVVNWTHTNSNQASLTISPSITTSYNATCTSNGCISEQGTIQIIVCNITKPVIAESFEGCGNGINPVSIILTASGCSEKYIWYDENENILQESINNMISVSLNVEDNSYLSKYISISCKQGECYSERSNTSVNATIIPKPFEGQTSPLLINLGDSYLLETGCEGSVLWGHTPITSASIEITPTSNINYTAICSINGCSSQQGSITVIVCNVPVPTITADRINIIIGQSVTLTAGNCSGQLVWEDNLLLTTRVVSPIETTSYGVKCVLSNGCESQYELKEIMVCPLIPSPTAQPQQRCGVGSVILSAGNCNGELLWYNSIESDEYFDSGSQIQVLDLNSSTYYYVACQIEGCSSVRKSVLATIKPIPAQPIASNSNICGVGTTTLSASNCAGIYKWYDVNSGGVAKAATQIFTTPILTSSKDYYVECFFNECSSIRTKVTVSVGQIPNPPTPTSSNRCGPGSVTLSAAGCTGTYKWFTSNTGGNPVASIASFITPSLSATTTYYVSCTIGSCTSSRVSAMATIKVQPLSPVIPSLTISSGQTATLTANGCSGSISWYNTLTGGVILGTNTNFTTPTLTTTTTFYASCTLTGCTSGTRGSGTVMILPVCNNQPDLYISNVNVTKYTSSKIYYTVSIKNKGTVNANLGSVFLGVRTSSDNLRNSNDTFKSQITVGGGHLTPNSTLNFAYASSFNFKNNQYYLINTIDDLELLSECTESNNSFIKLVNKCTSSSNLSLIGDLPEGYYSTNGIVTFNNVHFNNYTLISGKSIIGLPNSLSKNIELVIGNCLNSTSLLEEQNSLQNPEDVPQLQIIDFDSIEQNLKFQLTNDSEISITVWDESAKKNIYEGPKISCNAGLNKAIIDTQIWKRGNIYIIHIRHKKGIEAIVVEW